MTKKMNSLRSDADLNDDVRTKRTNSPRSSEKWIDNGKMKIDNSKTNSQRFSEKWIDNDKMKWKDLPRPDVS